MELSLSEYAPQEIPHTSSQPPKCFLCNQEDQLVVDSWSILRGGGGESVFSTVYHLNHLLKFNQNIESTRYTEHRFYRGTLIR